MKKYNSFWFVIGLVLASFLIAEAQDGEALYNQNCTACHKFGQKLIGPDLIGINEKRSEKWLIEFIRSSQSMIKSGDAEAVAIFEEFNQMVMNDQTHLSDADIKAILAHIESQSSSEAGNSETAEPIEEVVIEYTQEDIDKGKLLFSGKEQFANGGASCISCHNVTNDELISGGLLAKDLTKAFSRMGDAGVSSIISSSPFPVMSTAYQNNPLDSIEIVQLTAFLKHADEVSAEQMENNGNALFVFGGGGGIIILFLLIGLVWARRLRNSVKEDIYNR
ncbi:MAG: cytochrome c [Flavobacteriales bacterium]|nr:cytochrome c [Flavobacteriales bacterium]